MNAEEEKHVQRCKARLDHMRLVSGEGQTEPGLQKWNEARVDRVLVDYMLRQGQYESAQALANEANILVFEALCIFLFFFSRSDKKIVIGPR